LSSTRASLIIKDETGRLSPVSFIGVAQPLETPPIGLGELNQPLLRSTERDNQDIDPLLRHFSWAEILVPVKVREEQIGVLALSRPGRDGYFNLKQVSFLTQVAGVLAVGIENIYLFDSTRKQSRQRLMAQEEVRKNLSYLLHNEPLQQVTYAVAVIEQLLS
jgi:GAF domain-containing protein